MPAGVFHNLVVPESCGGCCTRLKDFGVRIGKKQILDNVNLHVHCGELTAVVGPNGAGKTTLLRAMLDEIPHQGTLEFLHADGKTAFDRFRIGYVPQKLDLDRTAPATVLDLFVAATSGKPIWFGFRPSRRERAIEMLERLNAAELCDARLGELSCGQLQRVLLALALIPLPNLLLLDEPVAGVDQAGIEAFYEIVSELRMKFDLSIFVVSHDVAAIGRVADRVVLLNRTILCEGKPDRIFSDPVFLRTMGMAAGAPCGQPNRTEAEK